MKTQTNLNKKTFKWLEKNATTIVVSLLVLLILFPFIVNRETPFGFYFDQEASWIGDAIGGITSPIIGLLSIFLIYLTYTSQKKEFKKLSRSSAIQNFESGFFYLLNNLEKSQPKEISFHLNFNYDFKYIFKEKFDINSSEPQYAQDVMLYKNGIENIRTKEINKESEVIKVVYELMLEDHLIAFKSYKIFFRKVYNLLLFIHQSDKISGKEKGKYIFIIRENIRTDIMTYLFYYCLLPEIVNFEKPNSFKSIVQYYNFFEYIEKECLIVKEHLNFYPYITFRFLTEDEKKEAVKMRNNLDDLLINI